MTHPKKGLSLTRKPGQSLQIGDDVRIEVEHVQGRIVRLRVYAPRELLILRTELLDHAPKEETPL